jgi:hypothetical protein
VLLVKRGWEGDEEIGERGEEGEDGGGGGEDNNG